MNFTSTQTGPWSDPATWGGAGVPGDGDFAVISGGFTVTIDRDIGSAGAGIRRIDVRDSGSALASDASAARTIVFASTGTDPIGAGTSSSPGADATMSGLMVGAGATLDLTGTAAYPVTLTSGDDTNPIYIHHAWGDFGAFDDASITLSYCALKHLGTGVAGFEGVTTDNNAGTGVLSITDCTFDDYYNALLARWSSGTLTFSRNTLKGRRSDASVSNPSNPCVGMAVEDNTESAPAVAGSLFKTTYIPRNASIRRNVLVIDGGAIRGTTVSCGGNTPGGAIGGNAIAENALLQAPPATAGDSGGAVVSYFAAAGDTGSTIARCVGDYSRQGMSLNGDSGGAGSASGGWFRNGAADTTGQGTGAIVYGGSWSVSGAVAVFESSNDNIGFLAYNGATATFDHLTVHGKSPLGTLSGSGLLYGDSGTLPAVGCKGRSCLLTSITKAIRDTGGTSGSTYAVDTPPGAGVHHNATFDVQADYETTATDPQGGTGFTDGTHLHPDAVYGDLDGVDPGYEDPGRTPATWGVSMGGAGTLADLAARFGSRCGLVGPDAGYTVAALHDYLQAGFAPTDAAYSAAAHDGTTIGAVPYAAPAATLPPYCVGGESGSFGFFEC